MIFFFDPHKLFQNLILGNRINGCCRLICDQKFRIARQRHGNHNPLAHSSAQFMWIFVHSFLGRRNALCFDFEVYSEAQKRWLEVSSVSNFDNYQANRLKCRYRDENKKTQLCHTLNGSALALPRIVAALLENNQTPEGIRIPKALVPYTGFDMIK